MVDKLIPALAALAITALLCATLLRAWRDWLELRRLELLHRRETGAMQGDAGTRIELAAVRERLRRLEEIASGVDL